MHFLKKLFHNYLITTPLLILIVLFTSGCITRYDVSGLIETGNLALQEKRYNLATESFQQAIQKNPKEENAYIFLAEIYILKGEYEKALSTVNQGIEVLGKTSSLMMKIGDIFFAQKDYTKARSFYLLGNTEDFITHYKLGLTYLEQNNIEEAIKELETASKLSYNFAEANYFFGLALCYSKPEEALKSLGNAQKSGGPKGIFEFNVNLKAKEFSESLKTALLEKDLLFRYALIAHALIEHRQPYLAFQFLNDILNQKPSYRDAKALNGSAYLLIGNLPKASEQLNSAYKIDPNHPSTSYLLGKLYRAQRENFEEVSEALIRAVQLDPERFEFSEELVDYYMENEKHKEASLEIERFLKQTSLADTSKEKAEFKIKLAYLYLDKLNEIKKGETIAKELYRLFEENKETGLKFVASEIYDLDGWSLFKTNKLQEALVSLEKSLTYNAFNELSFYHLSKVYSRLGENSRAKVNLERALELDLDKSLDAW